MKSAMSSDVDSLNFTRKLAVYWVTTEGGALYRALQKRWYQIQTDPSRQFNVLSVIDYGEFFFLTSPV